MYCKTLIVALLTSCAVSLSPFGAIAQESKRDIKGVTLGSSIEEARAKASVTYKCEPTNGLSTLCQNHDYTEGFIIFLTQREPHVVDAVSYVFCANGTFDAVFRDIMADFHGSTEDDSTSRKNLFGIGEKTNGILSQTGQCLGKDGALLNRFQLVIKDIDLLAKDQQDAVNPPNRVAPRL